MVYGICPRPKRFHNATGNRIFIVIDIPVIIPRGVYGLVLILISHCIGTRNGPARTKILAQQQTRGRGGLGFINGTYGISPGYHVREYIFGLWPCDYISIAIQKLIGIIVNIGTYTRGSGNIAVPYTGIVHLRGQFNNWRRWNVLYVYRHGKCTTPTIPYDYRIHSR